MAKLYKLLLVVAIFLGLTACTTNADVEPTRTSILSGSLQPYHSPVPSITPLPPTLAPTQPPLPTPTPHLYQVAGGDTMGSIALEFGIATNDLIAANPDVLPSSMSVGQELIIPDGEEEPIALPTLQPFALNISPPYYYPTLSGGVWCFLPVQNESDVAVESISAEIRLYNEMGDLFASETAFALLDRLPAGEKMVLLAFFADTPANISADATLLTAFESAKEDAPYLSASLQNVFTQIAWDGMSAEVSGEVLVEGRASQIRILAIAYNENGKVVGARRWESLSNEKIFSLTVASLGSAVERVELIVEAKP